MKFFSWASVAVAVLSFVSGSVAQDFTAQVVVNSITMLTTASSNLQAKTSSANIVNVAFIAPVSHQVLLSPEVI
jgi:hypothetical protein